MRAWIFITIAIFVVGHLLRDYLQELGVKDWFTTVGHFWDAPQYNVLGMGILIVVGFWADWEALTSQIVPERWRRRNFVTADALAKELPKQSWAASGQPMEPVSLALVGSKREILRRFRAHGWVLADRLTPVSALRFLRSLFLGRPYPRAPMGAGYIQGHHHDLGLERPAVKDSLGERHHVRVWKTGLRYRGHCVWVATASRDVALGLGATGRPTHHIDPDLARERSFISQALGLSGRRLTVDRAHWFKNANGDSMEWDGGVLLLRL